MNAFRRLSAATLLTLAFAPAASAQVPHNWQLGMQVAHSPVQQHVESLHQLVLAIITVITLFVLALLLFVSWRFNAARHPKASRTAHHTTLEVAWTVMPVLILVIIAIPSFRLIYFQDRVKDADLTIKVTGHQWAWEYSYPDNGNIDFTSNMVPVDDLKPGQLRLLDVDNQLVVPAGKNIRVLTTGADVIHSFFVPSLGVQRYAIPGMTIETWFRADQPGTYYGECNQVCGTNHSMMPIAVHAVTPEEFTAWLAEAKTKFAANAPDTAANAGPSPEPQRIAQAQR
jgi:cytochrome c oxidase subunit 2